MTIQLLILKMQAILGGRSDESQMQRRAIAMEYCRQCSDLEECLQHCVSLVKSGRDYAALQVAESSNLLDKANTLLFPELEEWRAYCYRESLPVPVPFDLSQLEIVNSLYSGEITQAHPLYRDYRRAMRLRKYVEALAIIKTISKINTFDLNARQECDRLRRRVDRELLSELSDALAKFDNEQILKISELLEPDAAILVDNPIWNRALEAKKVYESERARSRCAEIVDILSKIDINTDWREAISIISEFNTLSPLASPSDEDFELVEKKSVESAACQKEAIEAEKAQRAKMLLLAELDSEEQMPAQEKLRTLLNLFADAKKVLDSPSLNRAQKRISSLKRGIFMLKLGRCAMTLLLFAVIGGVSYFCYEQYKIYNTRTEADLYLSALENPMSSISSSEIVAKCADFEKKYPQLVKLSEYKLRLGNIANSANTSLKLIENVNASLNELENFDFLNAESIKFESAYKKIAALKDSKISELPKFERDSITDRLEKISMRAESQKDKRKRNFESTLNAGIDDCKRLHAEYSNYERDIESLNADFLKLSEKLNTILDSDGKFFDVDGNFKSAFDSISKHTKDARKKYEKLNALKNNIMASRDSDDFFEACNKAYVSDILPDDIKKSLSVIRERKENIEAGQALLFASLELFYASDNVREFSKAEIATSPSLIDSVYVYTLTDGKSRNKVYSFGEMKETSQKWSGGAETRQEIKQIKENEKEKLVSCVWQTLSGKSPKGEKLINGALTAESKLGAEVMKVAAEESLLKALIVVAKADVDPIFKLRLEAIIFNELKKNSVGSGLDFSASALDRKRVIESNSNAMGYTDKSWIFAQDSRRKMVNNELSSMKVPNYEVEAIKTLNAIREAKKNPMRFVGIVDENGNAQLFESPKGDLWAIDKSKKQFKSFGKASNIYQAKLMPLSPIYAETISTAEIEARASK